MLCGALLQCGAQEADTGGVHCRAKVCATVPTGTPALHRLAKVRECCMPYWSRVPQLFSHTMTMACMQKSQWPRIGHICGCFVQQSGVGSDSAFKHALHALLIACRL